MSKTMELFSARVCPFAHRTRLVLAEKGAEFTLSGIDLKNKPQRFLDISCYGRVPVLVHQGHALVESTIIRAVSITLFIRVLSLPLFDDLYSVEQIWI